MRRKVSSYEVAKLAGVSQATVSYVLNQRPNQSIREETRQRVINAARTLGYQPNHAARTLATGKTQSISLCVPYSYHSVFSHVIEQVMRLAEDDHYHVLVVQIYAKTPDTLPIGRRVPGANVDGILALDASELVDELLDDAIGFPPIVSFGAAYSTRTDHVGIDLGDGARQAVQHLVDSGRERVAYAGYRYDMRPGEPRYDAYMKVMSDCHRQPEIIPLEHGEYDDTYDGIRAYVGQHGHPDGIYCWNDETAIGINRALADLRLRVPQDIALVGSDGIRETRFAVPSISTVELPFAQMCEIAWKYLLNRLNNPDIAIQSTVLPMQLAVRESSGR